MLKNIISMKKFLVLFALLIPIMANSMKIEKDYIDEFTGEREIMTSWESLDKQRVHIRFHLRNGKYFLDFKYISGDAIVIGEGDKLQFKSNDGIICDFSSLAIYHGERGGGAVGGMGSGAWGISARYSGDVAWFQSNLPVLMRLNASREYIDFKLSEKDGYKLQDLANLFIATAEGNIAVKPVLYNIQYLKKKKSSREWDLVKEETDKRLNQEQLKALVEEWESQTTDKTEYKCSVKKAK